MANDYLSVSALTQYLKRKFELDPYLGKVYLTGEISNYRPRPHAHQYFSLKDDHAKINAIMFRSAFEKLKFQPETGMKVLVTGRISLYEPGGAYQIYVDRMEPDGVGQLYQAYEQLKNKLAQEGLFEVLQRPLPHFPRKIAIVTSPSGAVIRDIMTTVARRYPIAELILYPAVVQGQAAAADLVRQLQRINQRDDIDTVIIGRGGGSIEDLWPFNEETVARAIATSRAPVISSVGHETDTTIADLVADVRAATPTAAAELAVPVLSDELLRLQQLRMRTARAFAHQLQMQQTVLNKLTHAYVFQQPQRLYEAYVQRLDRDQTQLIQTMTWRLSDATQRATLTTQRLQAVAPLNEVHRQQDRLHNTQHQLQQAMIQIAQRTRQRLGEATAALDYLSPLKILGRGYSYVTDEDQQVVKKVTQLQVSQGIQLHLVDGQATAKITEITPESEQQS